MTSAVLFRRCLLGALGALPMLAPAATPVRAATANTPVAAAAVAASGCKLTVNHPAGSRTAYFRHCADTPEMVRFSGGRFMMGDAIGNGREFERPAHAVTVAPFAIGRYEVTRGEWAACVAAGACLSPSSVPNGAEAGPRHPVTGINWNQARQYVEWLAARSGQPYRLPSEAEWEYVMRAGVAADGAQTFSQPSQYTCSYANALDQSATLRHPELTWSAGCNDTFPDTAPVGSFPPNAFGVSDLQGNVWEWVEDCWHPTYEGAPTDGRAWVDDGGCRKRVNRGGGWGNGAGAMRPSNRDADAANNVSDALGFRVALTLPAAAGKRTAAPTPAPTATPR